jgi:hypothetical protein
MRVFNKSTAAFFILTALSLSIGWGIRGNFGHEYGAMIPGALAAMAAVLLSGREDWWRRIAYFAFFGALGWSFGGSMSYMQVIAYTHSGHSGSVLYGFACLFVIGFLWAAMGGAGTALPAVLDRDRLTEFFAPLTAVFIAWCLQDFAEHWLVAVNPDFRNESPLYWNDTDWLAALLAIVAVLALALIRRRVDNASPLILHMAIGWWVGFLLLVQMLGWRMTPPRGDNWAGCIGMVGGMIAYLWRSRLGAVLCAALVAGFVGGFGFATATMLKLIEIKSGWQTNWHSILEQTYGFINGLGVAAAMFWLARRLPAVNDRPPTRRWTEAFAVVFVLVGITYLNLQKNPAEWIRLKVVPETMYGLSAGTWFNLAYLAIAVAITWTLTCHLKSPLPLVPASSLGKGQLLYLIFLWWLVVGNFDRAQVAFTPQRLVTEGVILLNAVLCTLLLLLCAPLSTMPMMNAIVRFRSASSKTIAVGLVGMIVTVLLQWAVVRAIYGDQFAGHAGKHIRFGPNATATTRKPVPGLPHP